MKSRQFNPRLGALYIEVVENQLRDDNPPETRVTFERLRRDGYDENEAKRLIAMVVAAETFWMLKKQQTFDHERFVRNLNRLPKFPEDD